jgi:hypothetical protein
MPWALILGGVLSPLGIPVFVVALVALTAAVTSVYQLLDQRGDGEAEIWEVP